MTVAVETVTYQPAQHSATAAAASGSHGRVGERRKRNFSQTQRWLCFNVFGSTCMLGENVCVRWSRTCFTLHNFPVFAAFAATCHGWHTNITGKTGSFTWNHQLWWHLLQCFSNTRPWAVKIESASLPTCCYAVRRERTSTSPPAGWVAKLPAELTLMLTLIARSDGWVLFVRVKPLVAWGKETAWCRSSRQHQTFFRRASFLKPHSNRW